MLRRLDGVEDLRYWAWRSWPSQRPGQGVGDLGADVAADAEGGLDPSWAAGCQGVAIPAALPHQRQPTPDASRGSSGATSCSRRRKSSSRCRRTPMSSFISWIRS